MVPSWHHQSFDVPSNFFARQYFIAKKVLYCRLNPFKNVVYLKHWKTLYCNFLGERLEVKLSKIKCFHLRLIVTVYVYVQVKKFLQIISHFISIGSSYQVNPNNMKKTTSVVNQIQCTNATVHTINVQELNILLLISFIYSKILSSFEQWYRYFIVLLMFIKIWQITN